jgi:hypothetical protein
MSGAGMEHPLDPLPAEVQAQAQAEADRFYGERPAEAWQSATDASRARGWRRRAVGAGVALGLLAALALGVALALSSGAQAPVAVSIASTTASPTFLLDPVATVVPDGDPAADPEGDIVDEAEPEPEPPRLPAARPIEPASPDAPLAITRHGKEWRIEAHGASRLLAAQRLAQASGSSLLGDTALLAATRPLDLEWRGRSAAGAWQAVLGREISFVSECNASRCRVHVLGAQADTRSAPVSLPLALAARPEIPLPSTEPPAAPADAPSRPTDSADPRVAAHHD